MPAKTPQSAWVWCWVLDSSFLLLQSWVAARMAQVVGFLWSMREIWIVFLATNFGLGLCPSRTIAFGHWTSRWEHPPFCVSVSVIYLNKNKKSHRFPVLSQTVESVSLERVKASLKALSLNDCRTGGSLVCPVLALKAEETNFGDWSSHKVLGQRPKPSLQPLAQGTSAPCAASRATPPDSRNVSLQGTLGSHFTDEGCSTGWTQVCWVWESRAFAIIRCCHLYPY